MAKKKESQSIVPAGSTNLGLSMETPDFSNILSNPNMDVNEKRRQILLGVGMRSTRKKYPSKEARKAAAKERAKKKRAEKNRVLEKYGLGPRPKAPKMSWEQKKVMRSQKRKEKRDFLKEMATRNPDLAMQYGIDVSRFKKK